MQEVLEAPAEELVIANSESVNSRLEHSRITGEYYRDLATNYAFYHEQADLYKRTDGEDGQRWPSHPFPNENYANAIV